MGALIALQQRTFRMRDFLRIFVWGLVAAVSLTLAIFAGCLYLAFGNFPAPSTRIEKVLPDARFPK